MSGAMLTEAPSPVLLFGRCLGAGPSLSPQGEARKARRGCRSRSRSPVRRGPSKGDAASPQRLNARFAAAAIDGPRKPMALRVPTPGTYEASNSLETPTPTRARSSLPWEPSPVLATEAGAKGPGVAQGGPAADCDEEVWSILSGGALAQSAAPHVAAQAGSRTASPRDSADALRRGAVTPPGRSSARKEPPPLLRRKRRRPEMDTARAPGRRWLLPDFEDSMEVTRARSRRRMAARYPGVNIRR